MVRDLEGDPQSCQEEADQAGSCLCRRKVPQRKGQSRGDWQKCQDLKRDGPHQDPQSGGKRWKSAGAQEGQDNGSYRKEKDFQKCWTPQYPSLIRKEDSHRMAEGVVSMRVHTWRGGRWKATT